MAGIRRHLAAPSTAAAPAPDSARLLQSVPRSLSRRQSVALLAVFILVVGLVAAASALIRPSRARAFQLFHGSLFLDDDRAPVAVNLADGKPTVRLIDANAQVDASSESGLDAVPLDSSTLLLNTATGEFNLVDNTGFVVKTTAGGVPLPKRDEASVSTAVASGSSAYIVQAGRSSTAVYLVGPATVEAASSTTAKVTPRAFATIASGTTLAPGTVASANGELWLLTGATSARSLRQLTVPKNSNLGVELQSQVRASVTGVAAVGTATTGTDGTGAQLVGLATAGQVEVFSPDGGSHSFPVSGLDGVDQILPSTNAQGALSFLYHSRAGWSLVSTAGQELTGPTTLTGLDSGTRVVAPAASNGSLYTMDTGSSGRLWRIGRDGVVTAQPGQAVYPTQKSASGVQQEAGDFTDAYVIARSDRVVFNSPNHVLALTVFSDGSHSPVTIDKSAAVDLDAAGGAAAISGLQPRSSTPNQPTPPVPVTPPAQHIDNTVNCATTNQIPHIPTITGVTPAARSVQVTWSYPLLDPQDCVPSTYQVSVALVSTDAPPPPGVVIVQGQQGVNVTGLFPETEYRVVVTAFINGHGTPSPAVQATTGREGPAAPTGVVTSTDGNGNWTITWHSCGGAAGGCVPTVSWNVISQFCDGNGVSSPPAAFSVTGDPTLTSFTATLHADDSDLGRGLAFQVQGVGKLGDVGATAGDGGCSYSWQSPIASAFSLTASSPAAPVLGQPTSSTFTLNAGPDPIKAGGGVGAQYTYQLLADGAVVDTIGPTQATSATFSSVGYGQTYTGQVVVAAPRHPEANVSIGPVAIPTRAAWPAISILSASVTPNATNSPDGTLTVRIGGLSSAAADGETFSLSGSSLSCGNVSLPLSAGPLDPSTTAVTAAVDLTQYFGTCTVHVALVESGNETTPPVFGGTVSPSATLRAVMPATPTTPLAAADFTAAWNQTAQTCGLLASCSIAQLQLTGNDPLIGFARNWTETLSDSDATCGAASDDPHGVVGIQADDACVQAKGGTAGSFTMTVSYSYAGSSTVLSTTVTVAGSPPTYTAPPSH